MAIIVITVVTTRPRVIGYGNYVMQGFLARIVESVELVVVGMQCGVFVVYVRLPCGGIIPVVIEQLSLIQI